MKNFTMLELAFIGDAIHTQFVREYVVMYSNKKINEINLISSNFCSAKKQSSVLDNITEILDEEELNIVRMARNTKTKHSAKNAKPADYHKATAFEALIGWLYINKKTDRLKEILQLSIKE